MTRKALVVKANKIPKYPSRGYTRCRICGRSGSVFKDTLLCRIHFRKQIYEGLLPG
jgi:small subunit ribosomal protein S14